MFVEDKSNGEAQGPSLRGFIEWLSRQDPDSTYWYPDSQACACAQYAKAIGKTADWNARSWGGQDGYSWGRLDMLAADSPRTLDSPRTFGGLLARAEWALRHEEAAAGV